MAPVARALAGKAGVSSSTSDRPYVLDFYCAKARLAVEIDGMGHDMGDRPQRDTRRDAWLEARGITVLHLPASELTHRIDEAADAIVRMAAEMLCCGGPLHHASHGPPPPLRGGGFDRNFREDQP